MPDFEKSLLKFTIVPKFNTSYQAESLDILLSIEPTNLKADVTITAVSSYLTRNTWLSLSSDYWQATDDFGDLPIHRNAQESNVTRELVFQHDTFGGGKIPYEARPLAAKEVSSFQERATDLKYDQGGLIGSGFSFFLIPPGEKIFRLVVECDLAAALTGMSAVWNTGECDEPLRKLDRFQY